MDSKHFTPRAWAWYLTLPETRDGPGGTSNWFVAKAQVWKLIEWRSTKNWHLKVRQVEDVIQQLNSKFRKCQSEEAFQQHWVCLNGISNKAAEQTFLNPIFKTSCTCKLEASKRNNWNWNLPKTLLNSRVTNFHIENSISNKNWKYQKPTANLRATVEVNDQAIQRP